MALGAPAVILSLTPGNLMRTEGLAVEAMIGTVVGSVVNIILDPVFIFGLGMGAGGAAIATVLGNLVTDIILVCFVLKKSRKLTLSIHISGVKKQNLLAVFAIGIPASVTNLMQSLGMALMNRYLVQYGTDKVAAMGIAMKVNMIVMLIMVGFAFGAQPLIGYNYGAENRERLRKIIRFDLCVELVFSVVCAGLLALCAPQIMGIFMKDVGIIASGSLMLRCLLVSMPCAGVKMCIRDRSDIITFHQYENFDRVKQVVEELKKEGRPLVNTEWLNRILGNNIRELLPYFYENRIGSYHWGLVAGKSQFYLPWDYLREVKGLDLSLWQHDLYHEDFTPYDEEEISLFIKYGGMEMRK